MLGASGPQDSSRMDGWVTNNPRAHKARRDELERAVNYLLASDIAFGLISTGCLAAVCLADDCLQQEALAMGQVPSLASVETLTLLEQQPGVSLAASVETLTLVEQQPGMSLGVSEAFFVSPACTATANARTIAERIIRFIASILTVHCAYYN